jgi:uncharacterized protein YcbK (DUF882 family)
MSKSVSLNRRKLLTGLGCATATLAFPGLAVSAYRKPAQARHLAFDNLHTGEKLSLTYYENGFYVADALKEINYLLRDHRSGDVHRMDPQLIDLLYGLQAKLGTTKPFQIISGYRSPATNAKLRKESNGVAKKSMHMLGKAMDIRLEGVDSAWVKKAAIAMQRGGVGYYQASNFVHVDTGPVRSW